MTRLSNHTYFEIRVVGAYMRVAAIDEATGTEVVVSGPAGEAYEERLKQLALRKLQYRMNKDLPTG